MFPKIQSGSIFSDVAQTPGFLLTGSFTKPLAHGFVAGYFFQPITVHDTEVLKNLIG